MRTVTFGEATMKTILALILALAPRIISGPAIDGPQAATERIDGFIKAFDKAGTRPIWPGFDPKAWPLAVFDGERTILLRHPSPPSDFKAMPDRPGWSVFPGRFPAVVGNSTRDIGGIKTATVIATPASTVERSLLACVEEVFHVFWLSRHQGFRPNEMARYGYPLGDAENLRLILAEDEALARALDAGSDAAAAGWTAAAIRIRRGRTPRLDADVLAYETGMEMMEGTANFAARTALGEKTERTASRLREKRPAEDIRWRFYETGASLCWLLERLQPDWKTQIDGQPDLTTLALLDKAVSRRSVKPAEFSTAEAADLKAHAESDIAGLTGRRQQLRKELLDRPGSRVIIESAEGAEPFTLGRFDPINLFVLENGEVAQANFLTLSNAGGTVEMTNPGFARGSFAGTMGLTTPAGRHPFGQGIRAVTIAGIQGEPKVVRDGDTVSVEAPGVRIRLKGATVTTESGTIRIVLPARPPAQD